MSFTNRARDRGRETTLARSLMQALTIRRGYAASVPGTPELPNANAQE